MNKKTGLIIGIIIVIFGFLLVMSIAQSNASKKTVDYNKYDAYSIIPGNEDNGNIADHVRGNKDAKVKVFEYADYQCGGCASNAKSVDKLVAKYGDKVAFVQRTYIIPGHSYARPAALAAEAAGLQGYWEAYNRTLFENQEVWASSNLDASARTKKFEEYFERVSDGKGNLDKFREDINSPEAAAKVDFDNGISSKSGEIDYTPAFFMNGKFVDWAGQSQNNGDNVIRNSDPKNVDFIAFMSGVIDKALAEQK